MSYAVGIDLGGTNIKAIAVNEFGEVLHKATRKTNDGPGEHTVPTWAESTAELVALLQNKMHSRPRCLGLCAPGLAARDGRSIAFMPGRMAGLEGFDWTKFLAFPTTVNVMNDAQAALLGEVWNGAAVGYRNVFLLTLGTGVGGAIYSDGQLLRGQIGRAGHLGHICLNVDKPQDSVGIPGSLESAIAEGSVISRSEGRFKSTKALVDAVAEGDEFARTVWERSVYELACGVASLINVLDPELIVIGGGIAKAEAALYDSLDKHLEKLEWRPNGHRVPIIPAKLGEWAGAIGAAHNAILQTSSIDCAPLTGHSIQVESSRSL